MAREAHRIHKVVRALRRVFPPAYPVRVRIRRSIKKEFANCNLHGCVRDGRDEWSHFTIYLDGSAAFGVLCEALVHEWAHLLSWSHLHDANPDYHGHDETWGVWYAKLYSYVFYELTGV